MATTQDYINQLKKDKQNLVTMLNNMGVEATDNETFTSLTPKVGKIVTDPILQDKTITITENGTTNIVADEGYNGLNNVNVTVNVEGTGDSTNPQILFLIKNGVEQTNVTGGSTFEYIPNSGDDMPGLKFNGDGYLGLCAKVWSFWALTFNNTFDYKKYSRIYVEWAYPKASTPYAIKQSQVALRTTKSLIRIFLTEAEGVKERTISMLDLSNATEEDQIRLIVGNIGDGDNYTDYPAQIYNLFLVNHD